MSARLAPLRANALMPERPYILRRPLRFGTDQIITGRERRHESNPEVDQFARPAYTQAGIGSRGAGHDHPKRRLQLQAASPYD